jgi:hypothetical protein
MPSIEPHAQIHETAPFGTERAVRVLVRASRDGFLAGGAEQRPRSFRHAIRTTNGPGRHPAFADRGIPAGVTQNCEGPSFLGPRLLTRNLPRLGRIRVAWLLLTRDREELP